MTSLPRSALELAELSINLGYVRDASGRLIETAATDPRDVTRPAFHLVRTAEGNRWSTAAHLSDADRSSLEAALVAEPVVPLEALEATPPRLEGWGELYRGPAFRFRERIAPPALEVRLANVSSVLRTVPQLDWVREALPAALPLCVALDSHGTVVAVCPSSRSTQTLAAAGVETDEAHRGRGLATAVVAGWAAAVRAEGREPFYGTTWTNLASRAVARRLGLVLFGEDVHPV